MSLSDCDRASRRIPVGGRGGVGKGASMSPAVVWNHDDPHPALLLASRSLAAGASACTPCGAGSYYGSTGVRAFVTCYFFIDAIDQTNNLYVSNKPLT